VVDFLYNSQFMRQYRIARPTNLIAYIMSHGSSHISRYCLIRVL
jgi:hypothetical protein